MFSENPKDKTQQSIKKKSKTQKLELRNKKEEESVDYLIGLDNDKEAIFAE